MRLPFIQLQQSAWMRAKMLGRLIGVHRQHALGLMADLWQWALELAPEDEPVTGDVTDDADFTMLCTAVDWRKSGPELAIALEKAGVIERRPGGFRVRGAHCYSAILEKQKKDRERKRAKKAEQTAGPEPSAGTTRGIPAEVARNSSGGRAESAVNATQRNATQIEKALAPADAAACACSSGDTTDTPAAADAADGFEPVPSEQPPLALVGAPAPAKRGRPRKEPPSEFRAAQDKLCAAYAELLGAAYVWQAAKDTEALKRIWSAGLDELERRFRFGLHAEGWLNVATVAQLAAKWNDLGAALAKATDPPGALQRFPVEVQPWGSP